MMGMGNPGVFQSWPWPINTLTLSVGQGILWVQVGVCWGFMGIGVDQGVTVYFNKNTTIYTFNQSYSNLPSSKSHLNMSLNSLYLQTMLHCKPDFFKCSCWKCTHILGSERTTGLWLRAFKLSLQGPCCCEWEPCLSAQDPWPYVQEHDYP